MIDDDAKEIRLMKEMYLPDGDLHEDGAGRQRKFKWKNIGMIVVQYLLLHILPHKVQLGKFTTKNRLISKLNYI